MKHGGQLEPVRRERVAAEFRAELARQRRTKAGMAQAMGLHVDTLRLRLLGRRPFYPEEIVAGCHYLGLDLGPFLKDARG